MVHVGSTLVVLLIHIECRVEVEVLEEVDVSKCPCGPVDDILLVEVGLGIVGVVLARHTVRVTVGTYR